MKLEFARSWYEDYFKNYSSQNVVTELCAYGVRQCFGIPYGQNSITVEIREKNPRKRGFKKVVLREGCGPCDIVISGRHSQNILHSVVRFIKKHDLPNEFWVRIS